MNIYIIETGNIGHLRLKQKYEGTKANPCGTISDYSERELTRSQEQNWGLRND